MTIPVQTSPTRLVFRPAQPRLGQRIRALDDQRRAPASEPPHLSYSQVRTFSQCPLQWYLSRNYAPAFVSSALVFGGGFHAAAEAYYQAKLEGRNAELSELLAVFDQHWSRETEAKNLPVRFTAKLEDAAAMRQLAERMLAAFLASAKPATVVALEEPFALELAPDLPPVIGKVDLIEIRDDDDGVRRAYLVDLKTAARKPSDDDLDRDQLLLYALAAERVGWVKSLGLPLALRYDIVTKCKISEVVSIPVAPQTRDRPRFIEKARQCHRSMRAGIRYPAPGWQCAGCGHAALCARWPDLPAAEASAAA